MHKGSLLLMLGVAVTLAGGVVHGRLSNRWGPPADLRRVGDHLATLPEMLGEWQLVEAEEMPESAVQMLECAGHVIRTYTHRHSGARVKLALIAGPPGPIAVHTPEVCYNSRDWKLEEPRLAKEIHGGNSGPHTFWAVTMQAATASGERLRVYYGWTDGHDWRAAESPRYQFARSPYLIKLQLAGAVPFTVSPDADPCNEFLAALIRSGWKVAPSQEDEPGKAAG